MNIRTMIIHIFKEDSLLIINEINDFLQKNNLGQILFYKLLDNQ
jgi:hypothetical protein